MRYPPGAERVIAIGEKIHLGVMAFMQRGGAWGNAKKYMEKGSHAGKGSEVHRATVVGNTAGDPFKDTSGPSMNILINVMAIINLVIGPLLA